MELENLLRVREIIKSKKPEFLRQDFNKKARLRRRWKRPKGVHSKIRHNVKGKPKPVEQGYRSPEKVRGLHKSGLIMKVISTPKELEKLEKGKHGIIISLTVGNKKRIDIIKKSLQTGFDILNIKNPQDFVAKAEERLALKKNAEKKKGEVKEPKKEEKLSEKVEEDKDSEKKEKERVLTQRER